MSTSLVTSPVKHQQRVPLKAPQSAPVAAKNYGHPSPFQALASRVPAPPLSPGGRKRGRRESSDTCTSSPSDNENEGAQSFNSPQQQHPDCQTGEGTPNSRFGKVKDRLKYFDRSMSSLSEKTSRIPFGGIVKARPLPFAQLDDSEHSALSLRSRSSVHTTSSTGGFQQSMDKEYKVQRFPSSRAIEGDSLTQSERASSSEPTTPLSRPKLRIAVRVKDSPTRTDASKRAAIQKKIAKELSTASLSSNAKSSRTIVKALHESKIRVLAINDSATTSVANGRPSPDVSECPVSPVDAISELETKKDTSDQAFPGALQHGNSLPRLFVDNEKKSNRSSVQTDSAIKGSFTSDASVSTDVAVTSETRRSANRVNASEKFHRRRSSGGSTNVHRDDVNTSPAVRIDGRDFKETSTPTRGRGRVPRPSSPSRAEKRSSSPSPPRVPLQLTTSGRVVSMENYNPLSGSYHIRSRPQPLEQVKETKVAVLGQRADAYVSPVAVSNAIDLNPNLRINTTEEAQRLLDPQVGQVQGKPIQRIKRTGKVAADSEVVANSSSLGPSSPSNASRLHVASNQTSSSDPDSSSPSRLHVTQPYRIENPKTGQTISTLQSTSTLDTTITAPKTPRRSRDAGKTSPWNSAPRSTRDAANPSLKSPCNSNRSCATSGTSVMPSPWGVRLRPSSTRDLSASIPAPPLSPGKLIPDAATTTHTTSSSSTTFSQSSRIKSVASELDKPMERKPRSPAVTSELDQSQSSPTFELKTSEHRTPRSKCGRKSRVSSGEHTPSKVVKAFASSFVFGSKLLNDQTQDLSTLNLIAALPSPPLSPSKNSTSPGVRAQKRQPASPSTEKLSESLDGKGLKTPGVQRKLSTLDSLPTPDSSDLLPVKDRLRLFQALESVNKEIVKAREQVSARRRLTFSERQKLRLQSAKRIQARTRGMIQRQRHRRSLAARTIQAAVRRKIIRHVVRRRQAAIRIQAFARGIVPRFNYRLRSLHLNLEVIKQRRRSDLMLIQLRKWKAMEEMKKELDAKKTVETPTDDLELLQVEISQLKQQNSSYLETNHKLTEMHLQLKMMRMMTEQTLSIHNKNYETMEEAVNVLSEKNEALLNKLQRLEERVIKRQLEQEELKHRVLYEKKVRALTEKAISTIVEVVEARSDDQRLTVRVLAISNDEEIEDDLSMDVCSNPGKSLTTTEGTTDGGFELSFRVTGLEDDDISVLDVESTVGAFFSAREQRQRCDSKSMFEDLDATEEEEEILEEYEFVEEVVEDDSDSDACSCESSVYEERSVII